MWIGTEGGGLDLARPDGTVIKVFRHDPHDPSSLPPTPSTRSRWTRATGVWVGTSGGGLALATGAAAAPQSIRFRTLLPAPRPDQRHDLRRAGRWRRPHLAERQRRSDAARSRNWRGQDLPRRGRSRRTRSSPPTPISACATAGSVSAARAVSTSSIRRASRSARSRRAWRSRAWRSSAYRCKGRRRTGCAPASRSITATTSCRWISACSISLRPGTTTSRTGWRG